MKYTTVLAKTLAAWMLPLAVSTATLAPVPVQAQATTDLFPIRIAQQPQRWALAWYVANDKGWFKEMGLAPEFSTFSSGAVAIAAGASGSWDVGSAGDIPAMVGASRYGLQTIGLANYTAGILAIMAAQDKAEEYLKNPQAMRGKTIPVTSNTTGHWSAAECLAQKFGLRAQDYRFVNLSPPDINAAVMSGRYDVAAVWAPNTYILQDAIGAKVICTGDEIRLPVHDYLFVTPTFAQKNPEVVARVMAVYLRAIAWERAHPQEAIQYLKVFYDSVGVNIPDQYLEEELRGRRVFTIEEQDALMTPPSPGARSQLAQWWSQVGAFMQSVNVIRSIPDPDQLIVDKYLRMVQNDPKLRAFVAEGAK